MRAPGLQSNFALPLPSPPCRTISSSASTARCARWPGHATTSRPMPGAATPEAELSAGRPPHAAGLMRVNHTGEVCAQALYAAQALVARDAATRRSLAQAAREEEEHLAWTQARLAELDDRVVAAQPAVVRRLVRDRRGGGHRRRPRQPRFRRRDRAPGRGAPDRPHVEASRRPTRAAARSSPRCATTRRVTARWPRPRAPPSCRCRSGADAARRRRDEDARLPDLKPATCRDPAPAAGADGAATIACSGRRRVPPPPRAQRRQPRRPDRRAMRVAARVLPSRLARDRRTRPRARSPARRGRSPPAGSRPSPHRAPQPRRHSQARAARRAARDAAAHRCARADRGASPARRSAARRRRPCQRAASRAASRHSERHLQPRRHPARRAGRCAPRGGRARATPRGARLGRAQVVREKAA